MSRIEKRLDSSSVVDPTNTACSSDIALISILSWLWSYKDLALKTGEDEGESGEGIDLDENWSDKSLCKREMTDLRFNSSGSRPVPVYFLFRDTFSLVQQQEEEAHGTALLF